MTTTPWPHPRILAHRGGGSLAPENTLAGIRKAAAMGFGAVEFDVVLSADAVPVLIHDETNRPLAQLLAALEPPFPTAMGVLYCSPTESYEHDVYAQKGAALGKGDLDALLNSERTWEVVP